MPEVSEKIVAGQGAESFEERCEGAESSSSISNTACRWQGHLAVCLLVAWSHATMALAPGQRQNSADEPRSPPRGAFGARRNHGGAEPSHTAVPSERPTICPLTPHGDREREECALDKSLLIQTRAVKPRLQRTVASPTSEPEPGAQLAATGSCGSVTLTQGALRQLKFRGPVSREEEIRVVGGTKHRFTCVTPPASATEPSLP